MASTTECTAAILFIHLTFQKLTHLQLTGIMMIYQKSKQETTEYVYNRVCVFGEAQYLIGKVINTNRINTKHSIKHRSGSKPHIITKSSTIIDRHRIKDIKLLQLNLKYRVGTKESIKTWKSYIYIITQCFSHKGISAKKTTLPIGMIQ